MTGTKKKVQISENASLQEAHFTQSLAMTVAHEY